MMAEPSPPDGIPGEVPDFGDLVDMNSFYGYGPDGIGTSYVTADRAWRFSPTIPAWMQEGTYEYEDNTGEFSGEPWETRRGRFWAVLGGGTAGDGFGSKDVVRWKVPESLSTPGAEYSTHAFDLFAALPWWELRPSGTDEGFAGVDLVPAGAGTWGELDYITSGSTADGQWLLAYVPVTGDGARTFTVDMSALSGPARLAGSIRRPGTTSPSRTASSTTRVGPATSRRPANVMTGPTTGCSCSTPADRRAAARSRPPASTRRPT